MIMAVAVHMVGFIRVLVVPIGVADVYVVVRMLPFGVV